MANAVKKALARLKRGSLKQSTSRGVKYADPLYAGRHPFQTYMLILGVITGLPLLFGIVAAGSMNATLSPLLAFAWGAMLFLGSATALAGSYWMGTYDAALTIERIGLIAVGFAAVVYSCIILYAVGLTGGISAGIVLGFGLASLRRAFDIGQVIRHAIKNAQGV